MRHSVLRLMRFVAIGLFAVMAAIPAISQTSIQEEIVEGLEYHIGVPNCNKANNEGARGVSAIQLWVSATKSTTVRLTSETESFTFSVQKDRVKVVPLGDGYMNKESEVIKKLGIHLKSDDPISVTVFVSYRWSGEAYRVIPTDWLGLRYRTLNLYQDKTDKLLPSQLLIVGTKDNTSVTYTPAANTEGGVLAGKSKTIIINAGETFLIQNETRDIYSWTQGDLSGTRVVATAPIGVISGHTKGAFPRYNPTMLGTPANFMRNMLMEMMWPEELLGTEYISAPVMYINRYVRGIDVDDWGDLIRFVATEDNTVIMTMRQDGNGLKQLSPTLKAGDFFDITSQEFPGYYRSNKPVLVGQYGKAWRNSAVMETGKGENPANPSRNGCGMMLVLAPMANWCSSAVFKSADNMDNFMYVTFNSDDESKLTIDGVPFRSFFGGGIKKIPGTEISYAVRQIASGDHKIEGAKFAAYAYGNWDYTKDGFAYGYPTGINYANPCPDSLAVTETIQCGNVNGIARALPDNSDCAKLFNIRFLSDFSENYEFSSPTPFENDGRLGTFKLNVIDPTKPAKGVVRVQSRSGKAITRTYEYVPEDIIATPSLLDFGKVSLNDTICMMMTLKNPTTIPVTVNTLKIKDGRLEFFFKDINLPITIPAGEEIQINVCARPLVEQTGAIIDSVIAELSCFPKPLAELRVRTAEPMVYIEDFPFGKVPVNNERMLVKQIKNLLDVPITVTGMYSWDNKTNFTKVEDLTFPIVLEAGKAHSFKVYYNPLDEIGVQHIDTVWFNVNTTKIKIYSVWSGEGIVAGPFVNGFDWKERRVLDNFVDATTKSDGYEAEINYGNIGNSDLTAVTMSVVGSDGQYFNLPLSTVPGRLGSTDTDLKMKVHFKPEWVVGTRDGERPYLLEVVLKGFDNGVEKTATAELKGIGQQPHILMRDKVDFGSIPINTTKSDEGFVKSDGSMTLTIPDNGTVNSIRIVGVDAQYFTIDPKFFNQYSLPLTMNIGTQIQVPIVFAPNAARTNYVAELRVESDAPEQPVTMLVGSAYTTSTVKGIATATDNDFGSVITCFDNSGTVVFSNTSPDDVTARIVGTEIVGPDANYFKVVTPAAPFDVAQNATQNVQLIFAPSDKRVYNAVLQFSVSWSDPSIADTIVYAQLTGEGETIQSVVKIPNNYRMNVGDIGTFAVELADANLDRVDLDEFKVRVFFDPMVLAPKISKEDIITAGTLAEQFKIHAVSPIGNNGFFVDFTQVDPNNPVFLRGQGVLFRFRALGLLSVDQKSDLPCEFEPIGRRNCAAVNPLPGLVVLNPVCAQTLRPTGGSGQAYSLMPPTPNPAGSVVNFEYSVGLEAQTLVRLFNSVGEEVGVLVNESQKPGSYSVRFDAGDLPNGIYSYKIESGPYNQTQLLVIQR